jgi:hypothetical protein
MKYLAELFVIAAETVLKLHCGSKLLSTENISRKALSVNRAVVAPPPVDRRKRFVDYRNVEENGQNC